MHKQKRKLYTLGWLLPIALALLLLFVVCVTSNQAQPAKPLPQVLKGEYSQNGGPWMPLDGDTELSALSGDVVLRGSFERDIPKGRVLHYYLNHIAAVISVNGHELMRSGPVDGETTPAMCGTSWGSLSSPGITTEDIVEIRLQNPHRFGNKDAYSEFLGSLYVIDNNDLRALLSEKTLPYKEVGMLIIIVAMILLGVALAFAVLQKKFGIRITHLGFMALFAGVCFMLDTVDVSLWSRLVAFNTHALCLSIMLAIFELGMFVRYELTGRRRTAATAAVTAEGFVIGVTTILCIFGAAVLYDAMLLWLSAQIFICPVLLGCCLYETRQERHEDITLLYSSVLLLAAVFADIVNVFFGWWPYGTVSKSVFFVLLLFNLAKGTAWISRVYQAFSRAETLETELKNSRAVLAMTQIRAHFVFNVLNAISGMCKYDPEKADETVVCFSRYLRANIDIMQEDAPEPFSAAMRHLEDYVALEQIRFGDRVKFKKDIAVDDFMIPALVLQPIVENSIKHGLIPKPSGGTVLLRTWTDGESIYVSIQDDGEGFDTAAPLAPSSVGLNNVRFRLKHMVNGKMDIISEPGKGTTVTITLPCQED